LALYVRGVVLEMEDEPELNARIRNSQINVVPVSEVDGPSEVRVLITVEDAPDLVMGAPAPSPRFASLSSLCLDCSLDELQRSAPIGIDLDQYSVAVLAAPICEVLLLGTKALDEYEQIEQDCGLRRASLWWPARPSLAQLGSPDVMSAAEASNS
jgi:hypothetical protein